MNVYFISGLAADKRVFKNIELPAGYTPYYLDWVMPRGNESLQEYAEKLTETMDPSQPFVVLGLSFGGMLAIEIAKRFPAARAILISSAASPQNLPVYMRLAGKLRLHRIVPISIVKMAALTKRFLTDETKEEKKFLREMIRQSDPALIRWSMNAALTWHAEAPGLRYIHIHGSRDGILPLKYAGATHVIRGGGHLMILSRAKEINGILRQTLLTAG